MVQTENSVSTRVVETVARVSDTESQALPPLHEAIDTDALDALYADAGADSAERAAPTVLFSYAGYTVRVQSATDIEAREPSVEPTGSTET